jgi:hypothetical protein
LNNRRRLFGAAAAALVGGLLATGTAAAASSAPTTNASTARDAATATAVSQAVGISSMLYTGNGFDACSAPSESDMAEWRKYSPYDSIGIYIGGSGRACAQPNLTAKWVADEAAAGWHFSLMYEGPQAPSANCQSCEVITDPLAQADDAAKDAVNQAVALGFQPGVPILYTMRDYTPGGADSATVLSFLSGWTKDLGPLGYVSGVAGGMTSTVADLVADYSNSAYQIPQVIEFASGDGQQNTDDASIPAADWQQSQRINQYQSAHSETWGSTTLTVDSDYVDCQQGFGAQASYIPFRLGRNSQTVQEHVTGTTWLTIGGPASTIYVAYDELFAVTPNGQALYEFNGSTGGWTRISGAEAGYAVVQDSLFALSPDHSSVSEWNSRGSGTWTVVGGAASAIYGGGTGLIATNPGNTAAYKFTEPNPGEGTWTRIGGGGAAFAESGNAVFALATNRSYVARWNGSGTAWTVIGGAAQNIYGDALASVDGSVFATSPGNGAIFQYQGAPGKWSRIGGGGVQFSSGNSGLFGLAAVNGDVYTYDWNGTWTDLGGPAAAIATGS